MSAMDFSPIDSLALPLLLAGHFRAFRADGDFRLKHPGDCLDHTAPKLMKMGKMINKSAPA